MNKLSYTKLQLMFGKEKISHLKQKERDTSKYAGQDATGDWFLYSSKPTYHERQWLPKSGNDEVCWLCIGKPPEHPETTLLELP